MWTVINLLTATLFFLVFVVVGGGGFGSAALFAGSVVLRQWGSSGFCFHIRPIMVEIWEVITTIQLPFLFNRSFRLAVNTLYTTAVQKPFPL